MCLLPVEFSKCNCEKTLVVVQDLRDYYSYTYCSAELTQLQPYCISMLVSTVKKWFHKAHVTLDGFMELPEYMLICR